MKATKTPLNPTLQKYVEKLDITRIPMMRIPLLDELSVYIREHQERNEQASLLFVCTHNSRRSQLAQLWAQTFADLLDINASCESGGTEVTAFNFRAIAAAERAGFSIDQENPDGSILVSTAPDAPAHRYYSKLYSDAGTLENFAAIMTCSDADQNCPFIPGADRRIPIRYEDPGKFDGTPEEQQAYDDRCREIATEMFYVFSSV